jgi:hypothetical protein
MRVRNVMVSLLAAAGVIVSPLMAQPLPASSRTQHVILVMTDGFRWQ